MADIHHIGIRVADIEKVASVLTRAFGVQIQYDAKDRADQPRIAYARFRNCRLELIEDPANPPPGNDLAALDHIAVDAGEIVQAVGELASVGFKSLDSHPRVGAFGNQVAAFERSTFAGIKLHLVCQQEGREP
ncbi:hypothetical protein Vqi01_56930 [Micromonospora qiuiae]|uniref:VOC domain-containing protein n=1 Tax=Micromonospora qiuiae TaxID=502268 RepID=A0ABQ4JJC1_9ACTN|nr:VOC family protein [Micromonospora qiuiae]GIJ30531.1 hypothetical protein Vqi01_56930 [Micromonospora qiuiae]